MSDAALSRKRLSARLDELEAEARAYLDDSRSADEAVELDQTRQGRLSRMDAMQAQAMAAAANRRRKLQLVRIATALSRIDDGNFGACIT